MITIASLVAIGFATLLPEPVGAVYSHFCLICGSLGGVNALLNVLLFVPLGIGVALSGFPGRRALVVVCALSALIETTQFFVIPGRDSTIGDVLTNTLGGALGFAIGRYAFILRRPSPRIAFALSVGWSAIWLAIQIVSAFGFSPAIPRSAYYGQIARRLGNYEQFQGHVLRASVGNVTVPDSRFANSRRLRELLVCGAALTTTLVAAGSTQGIAPIVRVADSRQREIMLLAQKADNLLFGLRTGAGVLRLRAPVFVLPDLIPHASHDVKGLTTDTLTVSGSYSAREVSLNTQTVGVSHVRRIAITAALGWTLLLPFQWYIEGTHTELALSAIWVAGLLLPLGYWGISLIRLFPKQEAARFRMTAALVALALLYVGLVGVPHAFGLTAAPGSDWLAALIGIMLGGRAYSSVVYAGRGVVHARCR